MSNTSAEVIIDDIWAGQAPVLSARVTGADAANLAQADVSSIAVIVSSVDSVTGALTEVTAQAAVVVSTSVFDTLQTDGTWTIDATGYNFQHQPAGTNFATADCTFQVDYQFTLAAGGTAAASFQVTTKPMAAFS